MLGEGEAREQSGYSLPAGEAQERLKGIVADYLDATKRSATSEWKQKAMSGIAELGNNVLDLVSRSPDSSEECAILLREAAAITYQFYYELSHGIELIQGVGVSHEPSVAADGPMFTIPPLQTE